MIIDPKSPYTVSVGSPLTLTPPAGDVVGVELTNVSYYTCLVSSGGNKGYLAPSSYRTLSLPRQGDDVVLTPQATPNVSGTGQVYVAWLEPDDQPGLPGTFTPPSSAQVTPVTSVDTSYYSAVFSLGGTSVPFSASVNGKWTHVGTFSGFDTSGATNVVHLADNLNNPFFSVQVPANGSWSEHVDVLLQTISSEELGGFIFIAENGPARGSICWALNLSAP